MSLLNKLKNKKLRYTNRKLILSFVAVLAVPLVILSVVILINRNSAYKNATLTAQSGTFKSYELPKFKLMLNEGEGNKLSFIQAFAADEPEIESKLIDSQGNETDITTTAKETAEGEYDITVNPVLQYRPGDYTIETRIYSTIGERTITQDFSWGVLAFNTNKATYNPKETVKVDMGILG